MGGAPAVEADVDVADEEAAAEVELPVAEEVAELVVAVLGAVYLAGSRVPQVSWMEVVQFLWAVESPTLARLHSEKASWQTNCNISCQRQDWNQEYGAGLQCRWC